MPLGKEEQDRQKREVARAACDFVAANIEAGAVVGVGTGSTANFFIEELATIKNRISGAVASSEATKLRLEAQGIRVFDLNTVDRLPIYVDGADEIDHQLMMTKGGGGALTREKIVAAVAQIFVCVCDASKLVDTLGRFPLPVEVVPMASAYVTRELTRLGGKVHPRVGVVTDNGNQILDVHGLAITDPVALECTINQMAGVVTNGLFARRPADLLLLATERGVTAMRL